MIINNYISKYRNVKAHCVYMLISEGEVVYVGSTRYPFSRIKSHISSTKVFDVVDICECNESDMLNNEALQIIKFKPIYNKCIPSSDEYTLLTKCRDDLKIILSSLVSDLPLEIIGMNKAYVKNEHYKELVSTIERSVEIYMLNLNKEAEQEVTYQMV